MNQDGHLALHLVWLQRYEATGHKTCHVVQNDFASRKSRGNCSPERWWSHWAWWCSKSVWMLCWGTWFSENHWWRANGWTGWSCGSFPTLAILWFLSWDVAALPPASGRECYIPCSTCLEFRDPRAWLLHVQTENPTKGQREGCSRVCLGDICLAFHGGLAGVGVHCQEVVWFLLPINWVWVLLRGFSVGGTAPFNCQVVAWTWVFWCTLQIMERSKQTGEGTHK